MGSAPIGARFVPVVDEVNWNDYNKCPICAAVPGDPCLALSGQVAGGRPNGVPEPLKHAHGSRKLRKRAATLSGGGT
jgi:hypothetical protein